MALGTLLCPPIELGEQLNFTDMKPLTSLMKLDHKQKYGVKMRDLMPIILRRDLTPTYRCRRFKNTPSPTPHDLYIFLRFV
jgi:hypothetical protein